MRNSVDKKKGGRAFEVKKMEELKEEERWRGERGKEKEEEGTVGMG